MHNDNTNAVPVEALDVSEPITLSSFKEIAMPLAARGIPVIPILPRQKVAFLKNWPELGTTDPDQIEKWNDKNPQYNCGAVAKLNGYWMLDCDAPDLPETIEKETGQVFPRTFTVRSNKGLHFYFKHSAASQSLKKNIQLKDEQGTVRCDVKVDNGYVVAPGSIHPSGKRYEVVNDIDIVEAPDWLMTWIREQHQHAESDEAQHGTSQEKVKEGGRDNFLFKHACKLRGAGLPKSDALAALLSINENRCEPPMEDRVVQQKIDSAYRYEPETSTATTEKAIQKADPTPVDGRALLRSLEEHFRQYTVLEKGLPLVLSLWSIATHLFVGFDTFPYLAVTSPTKRCGKTRLGELLEGLCANPESTVELTRAALFRLIHENKPTLIIDEAESLSGKSECSEALRAILNVGYRKGKTVRRTAKQNEDGSFKLQEFETFCPKVIILIGNLPDTLADRCIPIHMKRRTNEYLARFRFATVAKEAAPLKSKMARWSAANVTEVMDYYQQNDLGFLSDRDAEIWLPLFAVLDRADRTRIAELQATAEQVSGAKAVNEPTELGIRLLADVRQIFAGPLGGAGQANSEELLESLKALEESPWKEWGFGKGLNARKLAELLRPYEIRPQNVRTGISGRVRKAYKKDSFKDAWDRYLPSASLATAVTPPIVTSASNFENENTAESDNEGGEDFVTPEIGEVGKATVVSSF